MNAAKRYIISCSFGKDSLATILLAKKHGEPLDEAVYCLTKRSLEKSQNTGTLYIPGASQLWSAWGSR